MTSVACVDKGAFKEKTGKLCDSVLARFRKTLRRYALFHVLFVVLGLVEMGTLLTLLYNFAESSTIALLLATLFLTAFTYFALRLYLQAKKPEQLTSLRDLYLQSCKSLLNYQEGIPEHHLALANAACRLCSSLQDEEYNLLRFSKLSALLHWRDVLMTRELLLLFAVDEYLKLVKCQPTTLEIHAALANAYVMLSCLYLDNREEERWTPPGRNSEELQERFRDTAKRAVEELNILKSFAPNNPWVHQQLAYSYHDLQMPEEEIGEYEHILQMQPDDTKTKFKLGIRYFQQGLNAKGLQIYESLKSQRYPKADDLMAFYGASLPTALAFE
jgi:tetratricopeptide (TPR) repeat protein